MTWPQILQEVPLIAQLTRPRGGEMCAGTELQVERCEGVAALNDETMRHLALSAAKRETSKSWMPGKLKRAGWNGGTLLKLMAEFTQVKVHWRWSLRTGPWARLVIGANCSRRAASQMQKLQIGQIVEAHEQQRLRGNGLNRREHLQVTGSDISVRPNIAPFAKCWVAAHTWPQTECPPPRG
jgi:hypothetical protein